MYDFTKQNSSNIIVLKSSRDLAEIVMQDLKILLFFLNEAYMRHAESSTKKIHKKYDLE